jgi:Ni/Fe-hydrogenase subunit HybB-like protein
VLAHCLGVISIGFAFYFKQLQFGLGITGMSRDVSWGFYIANFTFLVGVAAGGVMVVLPYYLHDYKAFGRITDYGRIFGHRFHRHVSAVYFSRPWTAPARLERAALPDTEFRAVL